MATKKKTNTPKVYIVRHPEEPTLSNGEDVCITVVYGESALRDHLKEFAGDQTNFEIRELGPQVPYSYIYDVKIGE